LKNQLLLKDESYQKLIEEKELEIKRLTENKNKEIEKLKSRNEKHFFYIYGRRNDDYSISNMTKIATH
jgi:hypothetical protein